MTVKSENVTAAASPKSRFKSTVVTKVTSQISWRQENERITTVLKALPKFPFNFRRGRHSVAIIFELY